MSAWKTFQELSGSDRRLLLSALSWIAFARFAILVLPFARIGRLASWRVRADQQSEPDRTHSIKRIRWAVSAVSRRVPWRALCFEQGLAAQIMLRRRGIPSTLYYGAASDAAAGLSAHVWVRDGATDVVGCEIASRYGVLAMFPAAQTPSS